LIDVDAVNGWQQRDGGAGVGDGKGGSEGGGHCVLGTTALARGVGWPKPTAQSQLSPRIEKERPRWRVAIEHLKSTTHVLPPLSPTGLLLPLGYPMAIFR
jgi:hypothetical protein